MQQRHILIVGNMSEGQLYWNRFSRRDIYSVYSRFSLHGVRACTAYYTGLAARTKGFDLVEETLVPTGGRMVRLFDSTELCQCSAT